MRLILASASPRRAELLHGAGYQFEVEPAHVDESVLPGESARAYALRVAGDKARLVAARHPGEAVLAADTIVVIDGQVLGKPADGAEAKGMLVRLSGRAHEVLTAVVLIGPGGAACDVVATQVRFRHLQPREIEGYVASAEPLDKAGAYGVQGLAGRFVDGIDGSYTNVVGLPVDEVKALLEAAGISARNAAAAPRAGEAGRFDPTGG